MHNNQLASILLLWALVGTCVINYYRLCLVLHVTLNLAAATRVQSGFIEGEIISDTLASCTTRH